MMGISPAMGMLSPLDTIARKFSMAATLVARARARQRRCSGTPDIRGEFSAPKSGMNIHSALPQRSICNSVRPRVGVAGIRRRTRIRRRLRLLRRRAVLVLQLAREPVEHRDLVVAR